MIRLREGEIFVPTANRGLRMKLLVQSVDSLTWQIHITGTTPRAGREDMVHDNKITFNDFQVRHAVEEGLWLPIWKCVPEGL